MPASLGHLTPFRAPCARLVAASAAYPPAGTNPNRRSALLAPALLAGLASSGAASVALPPPARADAPELVPFLGMDKPPTSYGGYGGTDPNELPKWNSVIPTKVEKGTQGIDAKIVDPSVKGHRIFVITLGRAGEDYAVYSLDDLDGTFSGFIGADYELNDAYSAATDIQKRERTSEAADGGTQKFFEYKIVADDVTYDSAITTARGRIYGLFVRTPRVLMGQPGAEALPRAVLDSFQMLNQVAYARG